jgi:hypothetical protein
MPKHYAMRQTETMQVTSPHTKPQNQMQQHGKFQVPAALQQ